MENRNNLADTPTTLLPNPGEGGILPPFDTIGDDGSTGTDVIVYPGNDSTGSGDTIVITPGSGSANRPSTGSGSSAPVVGGIQLLPGSTFPVVTGYANARFLNASHGYPAFRIYVDGRRTVNMLDSATASSYVRLTAGRHTITVTGQDGYIYLEKTFNFRSGTTSTVVILNRTGGLDMTIISDNCRVC